MTGGFRGETKKDWRWDASNTVGKNNFHFYGDKTFNASGGAAQNHFDDGGFSFLQNTSNYTVNLRALVFTDAMATRQIIISPSMINPHCPRVGTGGGVGGG